MTNGTPSDVFLVFLFQLPGTYLYPFPFELSHLGTLLLGSMISYPQDVSKISLIKTNPGHP